MIVHNFEDPLIAARLNYSIQACVIRRRFAQRSGRDLSALSQFLGDGMSDDLMELSADARREARPRPESARNSTCS